MIAKLFIKLGTAGSLILASITVPSVDGFAAEQFSGAVADKGNYQVIFHVDSDSEAAMKKTLGNIANLLTDPRLEGKLQVELLANSKGYKIFEKGNGLEKPLQDLLSKGVILAQCQNTLRELKIDKNSLYPFISTVPSGVGELTIREGNGWAYIHPSP